VSRPDLRAVIADDEAGARSHLRDLLSGCGVETIRECAVGEEVAPAVRALRPDLVCLDVRMPGPDGLEIAAQIGPAPPVIFTTGYADYAARAFELEATDYLLKPLSASRVGEAIRRVRARLALGASRLGGTTPAHVARIFIATDDHSIALAPESIRFAEARDGISIMHTDHGLYRLRTPLAAIEQALASCGFLRTHRAYIVNLRRVRALVPWSRHAFSLLLDGGEETHVPVAKSRLAAFRGSVIWIPGAGGQRGSRTAGQGRDRGGREQGIGARDRGGTGG
jgi:DNA-binding LytR/AlgR family response regulator